MPLYVLRLCERLPDLMPDCRFYFFINRGFEHNEPEARYLPRLKSLGGKPNVEWINKNHPAEIYWEQVLLPRMASAHGIHLLHFPGNRIPFFPGRPVVATVHDMMEKLFLEELVPIPAHAGPKLRFYFHRQRAYLKGQYRFGLPRAQRIITVSNYSAQDIARYMPVPEKKIVVVYHGLDPDFYTFDLEASLPREARTFSLMLGGDGFQKNAEGALAAWARVPEELRRRFPLRVAGFSGVKESPLLEALRRHGLEDEVQVEKWVDRDTLVKWFRDAAVFLFLSHYEGFGFPMLQAMAAGTPVVHSTASSLGELAADAGMGCHPGDIATAAENIESLLTDNELWSRKRKLGWERAAGFSWDEAARKHAAIYREVLESSR